MLTGVYLFIGSYTDTCLDCPEACDAQHFAMYMSYAKLKGQGLNNVVNAADFDRFTQGHEKATNLSIRIDREGFAEILTLIKMLERQIHVVDDRVTWVMQDLGTAKEEAYNVINAFVSQILRKDYPIYRNAVPSKFQLERAENSFASFLDSVSSLDDTDYHTLEDTTQHLLRFVPNELESCWEIFQIVLIAASEIIRIESSIDGSNNTAMSKESSLNYKRYQDLILNVTKGPGADQCYYDLGNMLHSPELSNEDLELPFNLPIPASYMSSIIKNHEELKLNLQNLKLMIADFLTDRLTLIELHTKSTQYQTTEAEPGDQCLGIKQRINQEDQR